MFYRGFSADDRDEDGLIKVETIQAPDLSCNFADLSQPADVRIRENGLQTDGCYRFSLATVRYECLANAVHAPLCGGEAENYSHCELRSLFTGESAEFEPIAKRERPKSKSHKRKRLGWRINLRNNIEIILQPG